MQSLIPGGGTEMCVLRGLVTALLIASVFCHDGITKVRLTPGCVSSYCRMFVTKTVTPRNYQYFHETLVSEFKQNGDQDKPNVNITVPTSLVGGHMGGLKTSDRGWILIRNPTNPHWSSVVESSNPYPSSRGETQAQQWTIIKGCRQPSFRIVGGQLATIQEIPYQVLYGRYCGGTLIAPEWVITAAHCKDKDNTVYVGSTYRSRGLPYQICAHFFHPLWNTTKTHSHDFDFQLVLLETPVPVTPSSRPIAIGSLDDIRPGAMVSVSGWGHTIYKKSKMQDILRRVYLPVIDRGECSSLPHGNYRNITARMFCAGFLSGHKDSCQGDSGGPAVVNGKLVGVVSFGIGCALPNMPGVYSNIPAVRDWIRRVTGLPL